MLTSPCATQRQAQFRVALTMPDVAIGVGRTKECTAMFSETWSDVEALSYIASYPDLIRAFGTNAQAGRDHYESTGWWEFRRTSFIPYDYLATYPDVVAVYGIDPLAAVRHYIDHGYAEGRTVSFSAYAYLAANPDLIDVYGTDPTTAARHYIKYGRAEGRSTTFDGYEYLAANPYLFAYGYTTLADAAYHYVTEGHDYGYATRFDGLHYVAANPDLIATIGTDNHAAARHYVLSGFDAGRSTEFDGLLYLASNPDLISVFGLNEKAATRHFVEHGYGEGRFLHFDSTAYLLSYVDLGQAGLDAEAALVHWIRHGYRETRDSDGAFGLEQADHALLLEGVTTGLIDGAGDRDWYALDLEVGARLTFLLSGNSAATLTLHDAFGIEIQPVETGPNGLLTFEIPEGGAYYLVVGGAVPGNYTITTDFLSGVVIGTEGDDNSLYGSSNDDLIQGLGGNDYIVGYSGNDILEGGAGDDEIYDDEGDDQLLGGAGNDRLTVGEDWYYSSTGRTALLDGGDGDDVLTFAGYDYSPIRDVVTALGGDGDDRIAVSHALTATVLAGAGNDEVAIDIFGGNQTITLGAGQDGLRLVNNWVGVPTVVTSGNRVTDFTFGADYLLTEAFMRELVWNWDGSNPFAAGYLTLEQVGVDVVLSIDADGSAGSYDSPVAVLTFENRLLSSFTAAELGYNPDGSTTVGMFQPGTAANDRLYGTAADDLILGSGGDDVLNGRLGNDRLDGGDGNDHLISDMGGIDYLLGRNGDDLLDVQLVDASQPNKAVLLDGGAGDDRIVLTYALDYYDRNETKDHFVIVAGGTGDDVIILDDVALSIIDAGAGDDHVTVDQASRSVITLGAGSDLVTLAGYGWSDYEGIDFTDFDVTSDRIDLSAVLSYLEDFNPFDIGYMKLVQSGADTLLQVDGDGSTSEYYQFTTLLTFKNMAATSLTSANLGYEPYVVA
jgi:Ca2+-binding RTX toxin-like protein